MKTLLLFLLSCGSLFAQLNISNPFYVAPILKAASAASGITADLWQTFEGGVDTNNLALNDNNSLGLWTTNDSALLFSSSTESSGLDGLTINGSTDAGHTKSAKRTYNSATNSYITFDLQTANSRATLDFAFWFKWQGTFGSNRRIVKCSGTGGGSHPRVDIVYSTKYVQFTSATITNGVALASNTWYKIVGQYSSNATCRAKVLDSAGSQVGVEISETGHNSNPRYFILSSDNIETIEANCTFFWDNVVLKWSSSSYPLIP